MLLFSTLLEIESTLTPDKFIELVIEWNQQTPHLENVVQGIRWNGERNVRFGTEQLWLEFAEHNNGSIVAARYEKIGQDGIVWNTDFVMNFDQMQMAIMLDRSYQEDALAGQTYVVAPFFITMLMERGYLKSDTGFAVQQNPHEMGQEQLELLASVINGETKPRLPVVYISKTQENENPVDPGWLARKLRGIAHVLVQSHAETNSALRTLCDGQNEYHGAIGIYFPNNAFQRVRYLYRRDSGQDLILAEKVRRTVFRYSTSQRIPGLFTWDGVNNAILSSHLSIQRAQRIEAEQAWMEAEEEVGQICAIYEQDYQKLRRVVDELTRANEALKYENAGLRSKLEATDALPALFFGNESEFYPGEIRDMVLSALQEARKGVHDHSRRADVLEDLLEANEYSQLCEERQRAIKQLLRSYSGMTKPIRQALMEMGFEISEDGKHYKIVYYGDGRYWYTLSKTPSENRGNKNAAADICNTMF